MNYLPYILSAVLIVLFALTFAYILVLRHWAKVRNQALMLASEQ